MAKGQVRTGFWWGPIQGKRPLARLKLIWEHNITMDLQEVEWGVDTLDVLRIGASSGLL
jgi:hypothetical protein